ncbi:hypothetical protein [Aquipseudomonas alcaligenes]|uniref:hypothetical protein n=1 Tax=Aquipseudomonas alcaligenes TaxID=43263 RepID=UPI0011B3C3E3|nr:hypothetical protein [Pseudomonas alcaligenes]
MKFAKKVRGFSMPQMIASVAIASVLTAVGANYYWDIVEEASTVGDTQSIEVVRDTVALTMRDSGGLHKVTQAFADQANARVSGLSSGVGNFILAKANASTSPTFSSWWYVMAFKKSDKSKALALSAKLESMYDADDGDEAGNVVYNTACSNTQDSSGTPQYSDCFVAFNLMRSPNATSAVGLVKTDITSAKISFKEDGAPLVGTAEIDEGSSSTLSTFLLK